MRCTGCTIFPYGDPTGNVLGAYRPPLLQQQGASVSALWRESHQSKYLSQGEVFTLVTSVVQTWNTLLEDLEKIDATIEEYLNEEER